ncbi:MAG: glycosyltransferase family 4 protein [Gaiellaceae bacterium]
MNSRVLIIYEWIPEYRRPFYIKLMDELAARGIALTVLAGTPTAVQAARNEAVVSDSLFVYTPTRRLKLGGAYLSWQTLGKQPRQHDLIIVEEALKHLETYALVLRQRFGGPPVALWGLGTDNIAWRTRRKRGRIARLVKRWLVGRSCWFFAYTEGGADYVAGNGFPRDRITVVQNSVDTSGLETAAAAVGETDKASLREELGLVEGATCLFVGALDKHKRLEFLFESCAQVAAKRSDFRLILAGDGVQRELVEQAAASSPWLHYVGRADARKEALLASVSELLLMPGSVGLVAVDSFALRIPIVTTDWPWQSPEFEHLEAETNSVVTPDDVSSFAGKVLDLLDDRSRRAHLEAGCAESAKHYSLSAMVSNFADGVESALAGVGKLNSSASRQE